MSYNWVWHDVDLYDTLVEHLLEKGCEPTNAQDIEVFHDDLKYTDVWFDTTKSIFTVGHVNLGICKSSSYKLIESELENEDLISLQEDFFLIIPDDYWIRPKSFIQTWSWEENTLDDVCSILEKRGYDLATKLKITDGKLYGGSTVLVYDAAQDQYKLISTNLDGSGDYRRYLPRDMKGALLFHPPGPPFFHFDFDSYEDYYPEISIKRWLWHDKNMIDEISTFFESEDYTLVSETHINTWLKQDLISTYVTFEMDDKSYIIEFFELDGNTSKKTYILLEPDDPRRNKEFKVTYWRVTEDERGINDDGFLYWGWKKGYSVSSIKFELEERYYRVEEDIYENNIAVKWQGTRVTEDGDRGYYIESSDGVRTRRFLHMVPIYPEDYNPDDHKKDFYGLMPDDYREDAKGRPRWSWQEVNCMSDLQAILEKRGFIVSEPFDHDFILLKWRGTRVFRNPDNTYNIEFHNGGGFVLFFKMAPADLVEPSQNND